MGNRYMGAAIATAGAKIPDNVLRRQEARARKELAEAQTVQYNAEAPKRELELERDMQNMKNELHASQAKGLQARTFAAFDRYEGDGDVKHINNFVTEAKQNPIGAKSFSDTVIIDPVTRTPEVEAQLAQMGITDLDGFFENPGEVGNFGMVTRPDGSQELHDIDKVYAKTGYTQHMEQRGLDKMSQRVLRSWLICVKA